MKQSIKTTLIVIMAALAACHNTDRQAEKKMAPGDTVVKQPPASPENRFANVSFASRKDTTCGMPLSAGIEDTVRLGGKVYGFCSKECKDEFVKTQQTPGR